MSYDQTTADLLRENAKLKQRAEAAEKALAKARKDTESLRVQLIRSTVPIYAVPHNFYGRKRGANAYQNGFEFAWKGIGRMVYGKSTVNFRHAEREGFEAGERAVRAAIDAAKEGK